MKKKTYGFWGGDEGLLEVPFPVPFSAGADFLTVEGPRLWVRLFLLGTTWLLISSSSSFYPIFQIKISIFFRSASSIPAQLSLVSVSSPPFCSNLNWIFFEKEMEMENQQRWKGRERERDCKPRVLGPKRLSLSLSWWFFFLWLCEIGIWFSLSL